MSKKEINLETSQIDWHELQRFFASGFAISVSKNLDLVDVAHQISIDNKKQVKYWLKDNSVHPVTDQQALSWYQKKATMWAVVVKPWVLVQEITHEQYRQ